MTGLLVGGTALMLLGAGIVELFEAGSQPLACHSLNGSPIICSAVPSPPIDVGRALRPFSTIYLLLLGAAALRLWKSRDSGSVAGAIAAIFVVVTLVGLQLHTTFPPMIAAISFGLAAIVVFWSSALPLSNVRR